MIGEVPLRPQRRDPYVDVCVLRPSPIDESELHTGSCHGVRSSHSVASDGTAGTCPCCASPPSCPTCRKKRLRVALRNYVSGDRLASFNMKPCETVECLMRLISTHCKAPVAKQQLVLPSRHGDILLKNKRLQIHELKPPCREKVRLRLAVTTPSDCAMCGKSEPNVTLRRCPGCMHIFFCSDRCMREFWPRHKHECDRHWRV